MPSRGAAAETSKRTPATKVDAVVASTVPTAEATLVFALTAPKSQKVTFVDLTFAGEVRPESNMARAVISHAATLDMDVVVTTARLV